MDFNHYLKKMWVGFKLRCPVCEEGIMSSGFFNFLQVHRKCPVCGVEFERRDGESLGAMMLNLVIVEMFVIFGFFFIELFTEIPFAPNAVFWVTFSILGPLVLYRHTRGVWIALVYFSGEMRQ
jgi:uncharacterized protein (DUF983 family)